MHDIHAVNLTLRSGKDGRICADMIIVHPAGVLALYEEHGPFETYDDVLTYATYAVAEFLVHGVDEAVASKFTGDMRHHETAPKVD